MSNAREMLIFLFDAQWRTVTHRDPVMNHRYLPSISLYRIVNAPNDHFHLASRHDQHVLKSLGYSSSSSAIHVYLLHPCSFMVYCYLFGVPLS